MNYPEASFGVPENSLSPLSPLHKWRGEALRRGEAKFEKPQGVPFSIAPKIIIRLNPVNLLILLIVFR
jgi:hypothetical protein